MSDMRELINEWCEEAKEAGFDILFVCRQTKSEHDHLRSSRIYSGGVHLSDYWAAYDTHTKDGRTILEQIDLRNALFHPFFDVTAVPRPEQIMVTLPKQRENQATVRFEYNYVTRQIKVIE